MASEAREIIPLTDGLAINTGLRWEVLYWDNVSAVNVEDEALCVWWNNNKDRADLKLGKENDVLYGEIMMHWGAWAKSQLDPDRD